MQHFVVFLPSFLYLVLLQSIYIANTCLSDIHFALCDIFEFFKSLEQWGSVLECQWGALTFEASLRLGSQKPLNLY
jgi:hypothetical protein